MADLMRSLNLLDVLSPDFLKDLLNRFSEATDVKTLITDNLGRPLIWSDCNNLFSKFCSRMRANPETKIECEKCDAFGGISASHRRLPFIYRCHMDLVEVSVPIFINNQYLGAIMIGQVRVEENEHNSLIKNISPAVDLNSDHELKSLYETTKNELPLIPLVKLRAHAKMLHSIANYITEISANSILQDANNQLTMRILQEENEKNELGKNLKEMELRNIQMHLKPQYLFNVLNTINNLVLLENPQRASEVISSLSQLMRYNLRYANQLSTIGEEFESIQDFLKIKNICLEDSITINTSVDETCFNAIIPPFSIQPIVENAFTHGLESKLDEAKVYLEISRFLDKIKITISDNGIGMSSSQLSYFLNLKNSVISNTTSSTLTNIIKILKHYFGEEFSWDIQSSNNQGTTVNFIIPYWPKEGGEIHVV